MKFWHAALVSLFTLGTALAAPAMKPSMRKPSSSPTDTYVSCSDQSGIHYVLHTMGNKITMKILGAAEPTAWALKGKRTGVEVESTGFDDTKGFFFPIDRDNKAGMFISFMDQSGKDGFTEMKVTAPKDVYGAINSDSVIVRTFSVFANSLHPNGDFITGDTGACFRM